MTRAMARRTCVLARRAYLQYLVGMASASAHFYRSSVAGRVDVCMKSQTDRDLYCRYISRKCKKK